jgi:hypothetical protein
MYLVLLIANCSSLPRPGILDASLRWTSSLVNSQSALVRIAPTVTTSSTSFTGFTRSAAKRERNGL